MNELPERRRARVLPEKPLRSAVGMLGFLVVLWAIELVDLLLPALALDGAGIEPRDVDGLDGILWAPLLHFGFGHLIANSVPLFVLGWLLLSGGVRQFLGVTAVVWLVAGVGTWLVADGGTTHAGASGVVFGWMVFLLLRGFVQRSAGQIVVALVLFFYWGGMLWGVLPGQPNVSWEGHLFGALGGLLAALLLARRSRPRSGRLNG
ncbi:rhomboid family intramembrane serine protease [Saccharopolyspora sp. CA-218241]|uniref:rhomboid family intramembrane serine protease n=1 Tax=Saccharopolyspora sp. CA-218241 TaxID=3240027 RepID=UPI003D9A03A1